MANHDETDVYGSGRGEHILIVEDDRDVSYFLRAILDEEGYVAEEVHDGRAALDYLQAHTDTALVILDLMLPVLNGWQFRKAQLARKDIAHIPVVIYTGHRSVVGDELPACAYLQKPGDLDALFETVRYCIDEGAHSS